jgi:methionyl-tRNA formyltransferase
MRDGLEDDRRVEEVHGVSAFRALFFGTPKFSVASLDALVEIAEVVGVVCQPDKPIGRGLKMAAPPVKERAIALGIPVVQPTKLRTGEFAAWARDQKADVALVIAYGRILPQDVLDAPRLGCVNVHASLLPSYRGAAPIAWAIVRGETKTGITLMKMDAGMDTGDMLEVHETPIGDDETAGELAERLSAIGADAVRAGLPRFVRGELVATPQDHARATTAPLLEKEMGRIDWTQSKKRIHDHVRGMNPQPMAFTTARGKRVIVHAARAFDGSASRDAVPGEIVIADKTRVVVAAGEGGRDLVELERVQLEGKRPIRGAEWFLGRGIAERDVLGAPA